MKTRIITTGGTIDKIYNPLTGELIFGKSYVPEMLARGRFTGETVLQRLLAKDSLDMTELDRESLVEACAAAPEDRIVVTHGTDTMVASAKAIRAHKNIGAKTVVLTGAMVPYSMGEGSDALFNFGAALAYAQALPSGVYVAMNGQAFEPDRVIKNTAIGTFQPY